LNSGAEVLTSKPGPRGLTIRLRRDAPQSPSDDRVVAPTGEP
jgi:hypothetical protein